ncbi:MAG: helix-turn-helix domain-containing protein [Sporolactobacillus sp.]
MNRLSQDTRKQLERAIRRADIVDAAERVFFAKGYDKASVDEIAKTAEFSKRTLYSYFNSKEQLYFEVMIRGYRLLLTTLNIKLQAAASAGAPEKLRCLFFTLLAFSRDQPTYFTAIMDYETSEASEAEGIEDRSRIECYRLGEQLFELLRGTLSQGEAEGSLRAGSGDEQTALMLWACTIGILNTAARKQSYLRHYHHADADDFITASFSRLLRLISRNGASSHEKTKAD